jgi:hypothetical protein
MSLLPWSVFATVALTACATPPAQLVMPSARVPGSFQVFTTALAAPARLALTATVTPVRAAQLSEGDIAVLVNPAQHFQTMLGIGGAITDASAEVYARLPPAAQAALPPCCAEGRRRQRHPIRQSLERAGVDEGQRTHGQGGLAAAGACRHVGELHGEVRAGV